MRWSPCASYIGRVNKACMRCYPISRLWRIRCRVLLRVANRCVSSFNTPARHHRCRSKFRRTKQNTHINTHINTHSFTAGKQRCERPSGLHYCTAAVVVYLFPKPHHSRKQTACVSGAERRRGDSTGKCCELGISDHVRSRGTVLSCLKESVITQSIRTQCPREPCNTLHRTKASKSEIMCLRQLAQFHNSNKLYTFLTKYPSMVKSGDSVSSEWLICVAFLTSWRKCGTFLCYMWN